ncbi:glycosyltransferase family 87 protein [Mycobacterium sp. 23]|uniref:glycosyltransferase family 87 protein n=1 Tax=Mycobacterium sp. 23 TaxID=3400424 RepID=UPI003AAAD449
MKQPLRTLRDGARIRERVAVVAGQSERTILLGTVLLASAVTVGTGFVLAHYLSVDVLTSLIVFLPNDCYLDWPTRVGSHCFSDYSITVSIGMVPNPWDPFPLYLPPDFKPTHFNYTAAGMLPQVFFGHLGAWLGAPRLGLLGYLFALTIALFTPAVWAARGARGLECVVVFVACGVAAVPLWVALDRGNSIGFIAPVGLVFLVALSRQRWGLVAIAVVLAALVKPQFVVLVVALFAARQWRAGSIAIAGVVLSNLAAYVLWPRDFPHTIMQSIHNTVAYGGASQAAAEGSNASLGKAILAIPDGIKAQLSGGKIPEGFLAETRSLIGYVLLLVVVVVVVALGRRIPPVMAGIVLLATASLFPALSNPYYLVFVLPVAAVVVRDPDGPPGRGILDRREAGCDGRRVVGVCVSIAVALSIGQIPLPTETRRVVQSGTNVALILVDSTMSLAPVLWLAALASILVSYSRRPSSLGADQEAEDNAVVDAGAAARHASDRPIAVDPGAQLRSRGCADEHP